MAVQHGKGQCDCPASSAYELEPEAPSVFQSLCMYLTCEWRRRQEEGEGEEGGGVGVGVGFMEA